MKTKVMLKLVAICVVASLSAFCRVLAEPDEGQRRTMSEVFAKVKNKLAIVEGDDGCGSGFVMAMENGKKFFITNKHVVQGMKKIVARCLDGRELELGEFEVATNRDLARFSLEDGIAALSFDPHEPTIGDSVYVFGNSDGFGVVTDLAGKIVGVGPESIEVDAEVVQGNSGSAVINKNGQVVGVVAIARHASEPNNFVKRNTRFNNVRRFAVRFTGVKWQKMDYYDFYRQSKKRMVAVGKFNANGIHCKTGKHASQYIKESGLNGFLIDVETGTVSVNPQASPGSLGARYAFFLTKKEDAQDISSPVGMRLAEERLRAAWYIYYYGTKREKRELKRLENSGILRRDGSFDEARAQDDWAKAFSVDRFYRLYSRLFNKGSVMAPTSGERKAIDYFSELTGAVNWIRKNLTQSKPSAD